MDVTIDLVAILVAVIASMIIGAVWYAPPVFGNAWMAGLGKSREELSADPTMGYLVAILSSVLTAVIMTYVVQWADAGDWVEGALTGAVVWLGFGLSPILTGGVFEKRPWSLMMINAGNLLLTFMVVGAVLAAMI